MKRILRHWLMRSLAVMIGGVILLCIGLSALAYYKPRGIISFAINHLAPQAHFEAESIRIRWGKNPRIQIKEARLGQMFKIPQITLLWSWSGLWNRQLEELRLEGAEIWIDVREFESDRKSNHSEKPSSSPPWHLKKLVLKHGSLTLVGLGARVPPLSMEIEGELEDFPLGGKLSEADLQKNRKVIIRHLAVHSPLDAAVSVLQIESIILDFHLDGLRSKSLDSLVFQHPILDVDRGFFWFVDELRKASLAKPRPPYKSGSDWMVRSFRIEKGKLDISRLREISLQYPFEFEVSRRDLNLQNLSLAQFQIEMNIPKQDIAWAAMQISFQNLHGKIALNMTSPKSEDQTANLVNTIYVDSIRWKELNLISPWLALTFDPHHITGSYGGVFAQGYINGGMVAGWSDKEPWQLWGAAASVDTGEISKALNSEAFSMEGKAELGFDLKGKQSALSGNLKLRSTTAGSIHIHSLERVIDRIKKSSEGAKRALLEAFVRNLKNYPYRNYQLEAQYQRPNGSLKFSAESDLGSRKLDLNWHGVENGALK